MAQQLLNSTQTLIYLGIAIASFVAVAGTFLFGHDHDLDHDHDMHGGGIGDHEISIFSPKIIFSFTLGFGAAGAMASSYGVRALFCVLCGIAIGLLMSLATYGIMALFYKQQASSIIPTDSAIGQI